MQSHFELFGLAPAFALDADDATATRLEAYLREKEVERARRIGEAIAQLDHASARIVRRGRW